MRHNEASQHAARLHVAARCRSVDRAGCAGAQHQTRPIWFDAHARHAALAREAGCVPVVGLMGENVLVGDPILPAEVTWFLARTEQITIMTPTIVDGAVD